MNAMTPKPSTESRPDFPRPALARWQPLRSGLVNLYKYDNEVFHFEKGRLLLRGNNGTGKSRVLALQLPFLLDGETSSHRVEPDGDPGKRFEWNLLMGRHEERTGYTWVEFGREDESGVARFLTLGCGLKAVDGRGVADRWLFITSLRVGDELELVGEAGVPLTRDRLEERLGGEGRIYRTVSEYRAAVDEALFQLGTRRYEALVNLLIQLRKPQLSREFNEDFLSSALSEALPPLDPAVLQVIAEAYRGLDHDRSELENFSAGRAALAEFLTEYSAYAKVASRRRAREVRSTHSAYEEIQRDLKAAETELDHALRCLEAAEAALARLNQDHAGAVERVRTLENSPEMRSARELERAREEARRCEERARLAQLDLDRAHEAEQAASRRLREAAARLQERTEETRERQALALQRAREISLELPEPASFSDPAGEPFGEPGAEPFGEPGAELDSRALGQWRERALAALETRRKAVSELERLEALLARVQSRLEMAKRTHAAESTRKAEAQERLDCRERELEREITALVDTTGSWLSELRRIELEDANALRSELEAWCEACSGESPVRHAVREAQLKLAGRMAEDRARLGARLSELDSRHEEILRTVAELEKGAHAEPALRPGIAPDRSARAEGAPLWRVLDFAPELTEPERAGLEAALEASGLLDAWITPEGELLSSDLNETFLSLSGSPAVPDGKGIARWLRPAVDHGDPRCARISEGLILELLRRIGAAPPDSGAPEGAAWISRDGGWCLGPLQGRWSKAKAVHIGEGAREAERRRRIEELRAEAAEAEREACATRARLDDLARSEAEAKAEVAAIPSEQPCIDAHRARDSARESISQADLRLQDAERAVLEIRGELERERKAHDETAAAFGLTGWEGKLRDLREGAILLERALSELGSSLALLESGRSRVEEARETHARAVEASCRLNEMSQKALQELAEARAFRDELEATIGASVEDVLVRLAAAKAEVQGLEKAREGEREARETARIDQARFQERSRLLREQLADAAGRRDQAITALGVFARTGLLGTAVPELRSGGDELSVSAWVDVSRRIEASLSTIDASDAAWQRRSRGIHHHFTTLQASLGALSYRAEGMNEGDLFVVRIPFQQRLCPVDEVERVFTAEVEARQRLLEAREREIIENHLIGEISSHIHDRLHAAEEWVERVNRELDERPTSTGMKLRFRWEVVEEGPEGFPEARRRLMRAAATWTEDDRALVAAFLHRRLQAEREGDSLRTWFDQLATAFDYRAWHVFHIERQQEGRWQRLTRRTFGTGSGGEKALMLSMPQFAAAAAHYRSADPRAPRLILLDEAFVAIDNDSRAKALGLLGVFDLDLMMTSEREWACYPTVPGISIYQLSARQGIDAVLATRWVWNGTRRHRPEQAAAPTPRGSLIPPPELEPAPELEPPPASS